MNRISNLTRFITHNCKSYIIVAQKDISLSDAEINNYFVNYPTSVYLSSNMPMGFTYMLAEILSFDNGGRIKLNHASKRLFFFDDDVD